MQNNSLLEVLGHYFTYFGGFKLGKSKYLPILFPTSRLPYDKCAVKGPETRNTKAPISDLELGPDFIP